MSTGACGINCDVCRLNLLDICSTCGSGKSSEGKAKAEAQKRILGQVCPILDCAMMNRIDYCLRDCQSFPCDNFKNGTYPYSDGYLNMHERRRKEHPPIQAPGGDVLSVPTAFWEDLEKKSMDIVCANALARRISGKNLMLRFLHEDIIVDIKDRSIWKETDPEQKALHNPLLQLMVMVYLNNASPFSIRNEMISINDLKDVHFFQGPHELRTEPVVNRYGNDLNGFIDAARYLGGQPIDAGDAGFKLLPFPKIPLYYILWEGDEEFKPRLSVLFDRSIERHLAADGIWGTVNLVSHALVKGPGWQL